MEFLPPRFSSLSSFRSLPLILFLLCSIIISSFTSLPLGLCLSFSLPRLPLHFFLFSEVTHNLNRLFPFCVSYTVKSECVSSFPLPVLQKKSVLKHKTNSVDEISSYLFSLFKVDVGKRKRNQEVESQTKRRSGQKEKMREENTREKENYREKKEHL